MESVSAESHNIRRTLRDLIALSALPAMWVDYDSRQLAESLIGVVLNAVRLDFVVLRLNDPAGTAPIEIARKRGDGPGIDDSRKLAALLPVHNVGQPAVLETVPDPLGGGTTRILQIRIGIEGDSGILIAGSQAASFPSDEDRLLLNISVNHAALVLQCRRAEYAMHQANSRVQLAVRGSNIGIWEIDMPDGVLRNGRIDFTNVWEQLGYDRPDSPTDFSTAMSLVHPDDVAPSEREISAYLADETDKLEIEQRVRRRDGTYRWILGRGVAIRDPQGKPVRLIGSSIDITELKQSETALREIEERFRHYFELGLVGMAITSPSTGCIEVNNEICRILGYTRDELLRMTWVELTHPDDRAADVANFNRVMAGEINGYTIDKRFIRKDGQAIDTTISVSCVRLDDGSVDYFVALVQDVTEQKRAEAALRETEKRLAADLEVMARLQDVSTHLVQAGDSSSLLLEIVDAAVAVTAADMGLIQLLDRTSDTLKTVASRGFERPFLEFFNAAQDHQVACRIAMQEGRRVVIEDVASSPMFAGTRALEPMLTAGARAVQSTPLTNRSGQLVGILSTQYRTPQRPTDRDLHVLDTLARQAADWIERMHGDDELRRAKEAAESANRAKDEFLANVSHEIRTPMNAILGMTELTLQTPLNDDQLQMLTTVQAAAENLLEVINDLLDVSKIEAGKLELNPVEFSLRGVLDETVKMLAVRAGEKGLRLAYRVHTDIPAVLFGDAVRLRQVLLNLIGNAIKFTDQGEVTIDVHDGGAKNPNDLSQQTAASASIPHSLFSLLHFTVRDTGIGIAADKQQKIFEAFEQADNSITRAYGGTGLGLNITARLVSLMGGTISVESELGKGSTFSFTARLALPSRALEVRQPASLGPSVVAPLRILVAEDNVFNARHLKRLLSQQGHSVQIAENGRVALEMLGIGKSELDTGRRDSHGFDLLLLDLHMPELDGLQVIQVIRDYERTVGGHLPVIALTARARSEDRQKCFEAGMDDFSSKPIRAAELFTSIQRLAAARAPWLIDAASLLAACSDDNEALRELCHDCELFLPDRLREVTAALNDHDLPRLREAAHKLCGLISAFSMVAGDSAAEIEDFAAAGRIDDVRALVPQLETIGQQLLAQIQSVTVDRLRRAL